MSLPLIVIVVELSSRALAHLRQASQWWFENLPSAPSAVEDDFEAAVTLIAMNPNIGCRSTATRYPALRRLFLERVG